MQQLLVNYQNLVLTAQQQVDDAISTFLQARAQLGDLRRSLQAASGALNAATDQYEQGATNFTTVLVAEQNLFQAEGNLSVASGNVALGMTSIYRALGGGWQIRQDSTFVTAVTNNEMRRRTNWGVLLSPPMRHSPKRPDCRLRPISGPSSALHSGETRFGRPGNSSIAAPRCPCCAAMSRRSNR